jgi:hypothetical protein
LSPSGRYQPIEPDAQGRLFSETTGVWFQVAPAGDQILLFDAATGRRLLSLAEQEELVIEAKAEAAREVEARKAAEAEIAHLQAEIARLRGES